MAPDAALSCSPAGFSSICRLGCSHRFAIFFGGLLPGRGEQMPCCLYQGAQLGPWRGPKMQCDAVTAPARNHDATPERSH